MLYIGKDYGKARQNIRALSGSDGQIEDDNERLFSIRDEDLIQRISLDKARAARATAEPHTAPAPRRRTTLRQRWAVAFKTLLKRGGSGPEPSSI